MPDPALPALVLPSSDGLWRSLPNLRRDLQARLELHPSLLPQEAPQASPWQGTPRPLWAEGVEEPINNRIGETSEDIGVYHPLPINMLYGYIAKIAYQIQDYVAARKAAKKCCNYFMEKTSVPELYLANENDPMIEYKLKQEAARKFSDIELRNAVEAFVVLARCDQMTYDALER